MLYCILEDGREHKEEIGTCISTFKMLQRSIKQRLWNTVFFMFILNHIHNLPPPSLPLPCNHFVYYGKVSIFIF